MKILVSGLGGYMGKEIAKLALDGFKGAELAGGVDINGCADFDVPCETAFGDCRTSADCIIDFSHHSATKDLVRFAVDSNTPLVIGTTGQTDDEQECIRTASEKIPVFFASNYSMGVALLVELAKKTASAFPEADIEIVETHHNRKVDAPSGTALTLAKEIASVLDGASIKCGRSGQGKREPGEIGISAVRRGNITGIHEVLVSTPNQTITLKHEAHSRALFAEGALTAAAWLMGKPAGLYNMKNIIEN